MNDYMLLAEVRMREALREAEHERLARLTEHYASRRAWYADLLAGMGEWLSARGASLQSRFGQVSASFPAAPENLRHA